MADLISGGPSASAYARASNNGGARAQSGPVPVGSPSNAAGIRGPREIMRERNAREAQRKAEQEAREQSRAEEEQKSIDLEDRKATERKLLAGSALGSRRGNSTGIVPASEAPEQVYRSETRAGSTSVGKPAAFTPTPATHARVQERMATAGDNASTIRPPLEASISQSRQRHPQESPQVPALSRVDLGHAVPSGSGAGQPQTASSSRRVTRTSFPHAFERWETLSAHWEGLTSYWVRRLEENSSEISREPLSQQMSRQITDLSAAGANLFHAVVELQRLRASSERKFQRWFFETRQQEEKTQEQIGRLEKALQDATNRRAKEIEDAVKVAVAAEKEKSTLQKQMAEMRRELSIAREEARRAWEELGRREQEERERTLSLRDGQPTLVGGVQVVPMTMGVTSRHSSARDRPPTRDGPSSSSEPLRSGQQQYSRSQQESLADPSMEPSRPQASATRTGNPSTSHAQYPRASPSQAASSSSPYYQHHQGVVLDTEYPTGQEQYDRSYDQSEPSSEEEYMIDNDEQYRRDPQGKKIMFNTGPDSDNAREDLQAHGQVHGDQYGQVPTSPTEQSPEDVYSGGGFPADWDAVRTHHHPTRLSDVLEEDERSRTSASQLSRG